MKGPLPKDPGQRRRRNLSPASVRLPAEGRKGDPPPFPLSRSKKSERDLWEEIWSTPQAVAWERLAWTRTVARYVRLVIRAEKPDAYASLLSEVRQLEDRLGLNPTAMLRLRWEIVADEIEGQREERGPTRRYIRAVDPDEQAGGRRG